MRDDKGRFLPGHGIGATTAEAKARMAAGNDSAKGRKGKAASPWGHWTPEVKRWSRRAE